MWDENFSTENRDNSPLPSINCSSLPKTLWNTGWFPGESFPSFEVKEIFDKTLRLPPPFAWNFAIPEFFPNTEVFSYEFYRLCGTTNFQRSLVVSPSYAYTFAIHELFWNTELFPSENIRYCVTKNFSTEKCDTPSLSLSDSYKFSIPKFLWNNEGMLTKLFGTVGPKNFDGKTWYPPFNP